MRKLIFSNGKIITPGASRRALLGAAAGMAGATAIAGCGVGQAVAALEYLVDTTRALGGYPALAEFQREHGSPHSLPLGKLAMESRGTFWWFASKQQQPGLDPGVTLTPAAPGRPVRHGAGDGWSYSLPRAGTAQEPAWKAE